MMDDVKYTIDNIGSLTEAERDAIYSGNALSLFNLETHVVAARSSLTTS